MYTLHSIRYLSFKIVFGVKCTTYYNNQVIQIIINNRLALKCLFTSLFFSKRLIYLLNYLIFHSHVLINTKSQEFHIFSASISNKKKTLGQTRIKNSPIFFFLIWHFGAVLVRVERCRLALIEVVIYSERKIKKNVLEESFYISNYGWCNSRKRFLNKVGLTFSRKFQVHIISKNVINIF